MRQVLKLQRNVGRGTEGDHWLGLVTCGQYIYVTISMNVGFVLCGELKGFFQNIPSCPPGRKFNSLLKDKQYHLFSLKPSHFPQLPTYTFASNKEIINFLIKEFRMEEI